MLARPSTAADIGAPEPAPQAAASGAAGLRSAPPGPDGSRWRSLRTKAASSFPSRAAAERTVSAALDAGDSEIASWLAGTKDRLVLNFDAGRTIGHILRRGEQLVREASHVRGCPRASSRESRRVPHRYRLSAKVMMSSYENLRLLFSGYFHQDWRLDDATPDDVLRRFARSEPPDVVAAAADELTHLTSTTPERELADVVMEEFGSYFDPSDGGESVSQWLHTARAKLLSHVRPAG